MKFDDGSRRFQDYPFQYVQDARISAVYSGPTSSTKIPRGIPAGGIEIQVEGKNLNAILSPKMYVYYDGQQFGSVRIYFIISNFYRTSY